jgi:serine/threonine-protein kinase RIM15
VFENILSGHIEWHEDWIEFRPETRDFMRRLMTVDVSQRLGANGADEVKAHPFFQGIEWDKVTTSEAAFIPQISDPESTDYFDPRGAIPQLFHDDDSIAVSNNSTSDSPIADQGSSVTSPNIPVPGTVTRDVTTPGSDDFGSFSFKNLPILKQANDDVIRKLKTDQMTPLTHTLAEPGSLHSRKRSVSQRHKKPPSVITTIDQKGMMPNPPSPATSTSSIASSPSRASLQPSTPASSVGHSRKPSEYVERFKHHYLDGERRGSVSSRLRTSSVSSAGDGSGSGSENWTWSSSLSHGSNYFECNTPPSSVHSIDLRKGPDPSDRAVTCLLAEDNPITAKIIETLLIRLGCRCVVVADGSEAVGVAMGDISELLVSSVVLRNLNAVSTSEFDCILMDLYMPLREFQSHNSYFVVIDLSCPVDGESAARYIKSTNNKNTTTPIIAVSAYSAVDPNETSKVFAAFLSKPLQKANLLAVMQKLGFKTSTIQGGVQATKLTASLCIP